MDVKLAEIGRAEGDPPPRAVALSDVIPIDTRVLTLQFIARAVVTTKGMRGKGAGFCYPIWSVIRRWLRFLQQDEPASRPFSGANEPLQ